MSSCLELFLDDVLEQVDTLLVWILLVAGLLSGLALSLTVYLIISWVCMCKRKDRFTVLYVKKDDIENDVLVFENDSISERTEKITPSGIELIESYSTPSDTSKTLTHPDSNRFVAKDFSAILCKKEWLEMKQDLYLQERNILSEFESAYKNLMHHILAWTLCQSMNNLSNDSKADLCNKILKSESVNMGILIALKYIDQMSEGETNEKEASIHRMVEGVSNTVQGLSQVSQDHLKNLEEMFSRRQATTESYANHIAELLVCVTNHFSKEKSELEVHEAMITGIDIFCIQLDELWETSITYYLENLAQESSKLHKQLEDSTEAQTDFLKKKWTNMQNEITKQGNELSMVASWSDFQTFASESILQFQSYCHEVIRMEELITDVVFKEYSLLAEHLGQGHLTELFTKEVALYSTFFQAQEHFTLSKQIMEANGIDTQQVKEKLRQLRQQQTQDLQEKLSKLANDTVENKLLASIVERDNSTNIMIEADLGLTKQQKSNMVALNTALTLASAVEIGVNYGKEKRRIMLNLAYNQNEFIQNIIDQRDMLLNLPRFTSIHENIKKLPAYITKDNALMQQFMEYQKALERSTAMTVKDKKGEVDNVIQQIMDENHKLEDEKVTFYKKQEKAFDILKNKLIEHLDQSGEKQLGDQLLQEHQLMAKQLQEEMESCKERHQKLLEQKLQVKKLGRQTLDPLTNVAIAPTPLPSIPDIVPWQPGSGTRFAMNAFIQLLHEVRRKNKLKCLEADYGNKSIQVNKRLSLQVKLQLQLKESELISKLAKACKLSNDEIKMHLKEAMKETGEDPQIATSGSLLKLN